MAVEQDEWIDAEPPTTGSVSNGQGSEDDWRDAAPQGDTANALPQDSPQGTQAAGPAAGGDDWVDAPAQSAGAGEGEPPIRDPSAPGAFVRAGLKAAPVGAVAGVGALQAGAIGAGIGTAIGGPGFGTGAGALIGGAAGALGYGWVANYAEDALMSAMGWDKDGLLGSKQAAADKAAHPTAQFAGEVAGNTLPAFGMGSVPLAARALGAGAGAGMEAGTELYQGEGLDPTKIAIAGAANAAFAKPRGWAEATANRVTPKAYRHGNIAGENPNPDLKAEPAGEQPPDIDFNPDVKQPLEPTATPIPEAADMSRANDVDTGGIGTAKENSPAPEITGVGNPDGAPMVAREGARPSDPGRNYSKDANPTGEQADGVVQNQSPVAPDMAQALGGKTEQAPQPGPETKPEVGSTPEQTPPQGAVPTNLPEGHVALEPTHAVPGDQSIREAADRFPAPAPEPRQTGLTPGEIKASTEARRALKEAGYNRLLAEIDRRGMSPKDTINALRKAKNALESTSGEAIGRENKGDRGVAETPRPKLASGAQGRSKADVARKEAAVNFVLDHHAKFGPDAEAFKGVDVNDPEAVRKYAQQTYQQVLKANKGLDPTSRKFYRPVQQTDAMADGYEWMKALKNAAKPGATVKDISNFTAHQTTKGLGVSSRSIGKTEGDIQHRPQIEEAAAEAETATDARAPDRSHYEPVPLDKRPGADNSVPEAENKLRDWINNLPNNEFDKLSTQYDVGAELSEPGDPASLHKEMQDFLAKDNSRRVLKQSKETPAVEQPATLAKDAFEPAKAETGKVIDRNTEAGKKLFEEYNKKLAEPIPEKDADRLKFEEANLKSAAQTFKDMLYDEKGGSNKLALGMMNWMKKQPNSLTSPDRDVHAKQIGDSLGDEFSEYSKGMGVITSRMRQMADLVPKFPSRKTAFEAYRDAYQHLEDNPDPAKDLTLKDDKVFQLVHLTRKMQDEYNKALALIRHYDPEGDIIKLPPADKMQPVEKGFLNRMRKFDPTTDDTQPDPFHGTDRQLSTWKGPLEDRTFKTLTDGKGLRVLFNAKDSGGIQVWHDGRPVDRSTPMDFEGNVGDTVKVNVNKKPMTLTVDNATAREIMKHARDEKGGKIEYHENPILATANAAIQANQALETMKLIRSVKDNTALRDASRFGPTQKEIKDLDLKQTKLKQFEQMGGKDWFMPRRVAERLDDYRQAGLDEDSLNWLAKANVNLMKSLWVVSPLIHGFNIAAAWVPQRGFDLLSPKGNMWLAKTTAKAIHSVITQDMSVLEPAMKNGLTLMTPGAKNMHLMQGIARKGGHELMTNPPKWWDAMIYPEWGLRASDVGKEMLKGSNTITWSMADVMALQRYHENIDRRGMWPKDAAKEAHEWLADYQVPPRVGESTLNKIPGVKGHAPAISRSVSKILRSPALSLFGSYHYDLFKTLARTTKGVVQGNPKAAGQMMALAVGTYLVYPYLMDTAAQKITGNENANVGRRGPTAPFQAIGDALGADHMVGSLIRMMGGTPAKPIVNPPKLGTDIYMAPPMVKMFSEGLENKDFTGHKIYPTSIAEGNQMGWSKATRHVLDWLGSTLLPPYQMLSSETKKQGEKSGMGTRLLEEQFGIREPSPAAVKYQNQQPKYIKKEQNYRRRREGPLEGLF